MRFKDREVNCYHIDLIQSSSIHDLVKDYTEIVQSHLETHSTNSDDIYFAGNGLCGEISIGVLQELLKRDDFRGRFTKIHVYFEEHSVPMPDRALSMGMWSLYPFLSACWTIDTVESLKQLQRDYSDVMITFEDTLKIKKNSPIHCRGLCSN